MHGMFYSLDSKTTRPGPQSKTPDLNVSDFHRAIFLISKRWKMGKKSRKQENFVKYFYSLKKESKKYSTARSCMLVLIR